jgi:hypothetical protein
MSVISQGLPKNARAGLTVTGLTQGHTTQVGAHTEHDQPFGSLDTVVVGLGITERLDVDLVGLLNLVGGSVSDENGFTTKHTRK